MLAGVEILLERMKTNPEEFVEGGYSKWTRVLDAGWSVMTVEEQKALQDAINEAKREHFNGEVMRVLAGNVEEEPTVEEYYKQKHLMRVGATSPQNALMGSAIIPSQNALLHATSILSDEFDKAYAGQQNTASNPYQQRK